MNPFSQAVRRPRRPSATAIIVVATFVAFLPVALVGGLDWAALAAGFIPARLAGTLVLEGALPAWLTPLTATLVHAGALHLMMNMLMVGFCGRLVEDAIGARGLLILYGVGAYAAAAGQYLVGPHEVTPMVGASGSASAVLAVYALLYGRPREAVAHPLLNRLVNVAWLAAAWIGLQLLFGLAGSGQGMPIAIAAHIGGFLAGLALAPMLLSRYSKNRL